MMQEGQPIAYLSKALGHKHLGLSTYEKELLAVIIATQKWRSYLLGHPFIIKTDQEALKHLMEQKITTGLQQKWLSKLLGFDYTVQYKRGKENLAADALSRLHGDSELYTIVHSVKPLWRSELAESLIQDDQAQKLIAELTIDAARVQGYSLSEGDLMKEGRFYVGNSTDLKQRICSVMHSSPEGGHSGINATIKRIERTFYWPGLKNEVTLFVKECTTCQRNKIDHIHPQGLLQPIAIPNGAWEAISLDFVEGLPKSKGKDTILVIVDRFTKYCHLIPLTHPYNAAKVAQEVMDQVIKLHGVPLVIISDRDPIFISSFWKELFTSLGSKVKLSTAYHPQTDGQTVLSKPVHRNVSEMYSWTSTLLLGSVALLS